MPTISMPGYADLDLPDGMSQLEMEAAIDAGIGSGQIKPIEQSGFSKYLDQAVHNPLSQFVLGAGDQFVNAFKNVANTIAPQSMQTPMTQFGQGGAYEAGKIAGDIGAFLPMAGGAGNALRLAEGLPGILGRGASRLGSAAVPGTHGAPLGALQANAIERSLGGASGITGRALGSAAYGATQMPENRGLGAAEMGLASGITDSLLRGLSRALPGSLLSKGLPTEELLENLRVSKGTDTGLGRIIGSPKIMGQHENVLSKVPFSGVTDTQAEIKEQIEKKGMNILNEYKDGVPNDKIGTKISKYLKDAYNSVNQEKNRLYSIPESLSDKLKYRVNTENIGNAVRGHLKSLDERDLISLPKPTIELFDNILANDKEIKKLHENLSFLPSSMREKAIQSLDLQSKNKVSMRLHDANISKAAIRDLAKDFKSSPLPNDRHKAKILYRLSKALTKDRDSALNEFSGSGHPEIKEGIKFADDYYANSFAPYLKKNLYSRINGKQYEEKSPETIVSEFIRKNTENDRFDLIDQLMDALPEKGKDLVKYSYLSKALQDGEVNPMKLRTRINKLGDLQTASLFPKEGESQRLKDYARLAGLNEKSFIRMLNPETGAKAMSFMPYLTASAGSTLAGLAGILGGGALGAAAGFAAPFVLANYMHKGFSSEMLRNFLAKRIMKAKENKNKQPFKRTSEVLKSGIGSALRSREEE